MALGPGRHHRRGPFSTTKVGTARCFRGFYAARAARGIIRFTVYPDRALYYVFDAPGRSNHYIGVFSDPFVADEYLFSELRGATNLGSLRLSLEQNWRGVLPLLHRIPGSTTSP